MSQIGPMPLGPGPGTPSVHRTASAADTQLRKTALQLEGTFVQRMFAAMRETVPTEGIVSTGSAESTFTSLLDEKLAEQVPSQWNGEHSLAEALYKQLRRRIELPAPASTGSDSR